jgi:hypothetical protein
MSFKAIKTIYWTAFGLSIIILPLNIGLGLIGLGIVILPILILHLAIGLGLDRIENHKTSIILSALNLLLFALIRPDGVHAITDSGLSSLLDIFGVHAGYNHKYEDYFFVASLFLLFVQVIMDMRLRKLKKASG